MRVGQILSVCRLKIRTCIHIPSIHIKKPRCGKHLEISLWEGEERWIPGTYYLVGLANHVL